MLDNDINYNISMFESDLIALINNYGSGKLPIGVVKLIIDKYQKKLEDQYIACLNNLSFQNISISKQTVSQD